MNNQPHHRLLIYRDFFASELKDFDLRKESKITNGIVKERKCTDLKCVVAFVICMLIAAGFQLHALLYGDIRNIYADYDGDGMFCGIKQG